MSTWHFDESAAQFPPKRSEEPANLRREIVEELRDHLTCARRREQMAGGEQTEEAVRRRVLNRFGDPAAVARKLWLDWMWEKIMNQRILVATCALLAVISCVALGLAWASLNRQEDLIATWQSTSETQMRDQQKLFERLLAESQKGKTPSDWNPVELRFVKGRENGPPAEGISVTMSINDAGSGIPPISGTSDGKGIVRFERVRYGSYRLDFGNAAGEHYSYSIAIQPGESRTETVVCPQSPPNRIAVIPEIVWPEELSDRSLWAHFDPEGVHRPLGGSRWSPPNSILVDEKGNNISPRFEPLIAPNGEIVGMNSRISRSMGGRGWWKPTRDALILPSGRRGSAGGASGALSGLFEMTNGIQWPGPEYRFNRLQVLTFDRNISTVEELKQSQTESTGGRSSRGFANRLMSFYGLTLEAADWGYRIEPGANDKPGTLWLTPTDAAVEKIRAALAEVDQVREAEEKARVEREQARAESQKQQPSTVAPDGKKKDGADDK
jgi:hypothetical protein